MRPDNKPMMQQGWLRAMIFCIVYFSLMFAAAMVLSMLRLLPAAGEKTGVPYLMFIVGAVISIGLAWLFRTFVDRRSFNSIGLSFDKNGQHAASGFFMGIFILCAGTSILFFSRSLVWTDINFNANELFISFGLMVIVALSEEIAFRGYILNNLLDSLNKWPALLVSALIFALAHMANPSFSIVAAINIFLAGILLGINYIYTKNLWFGIMLHFTWNFFQGPVLGYEVSGLPLQSLFRHELQGSPLLTGSSFGFEGSLIATLLCILATGALVWVYEKKYTSWPAAAASTTH